MNRPMRFLVSAALATTVVLAMMVAALAAFGLFDRGEEVIYAHPVEGLSQSDRVDVAELVGAPQRQIPARPVARPVEPLVVPRRDVSGFVQIEVEVDDDGRVQRAEVVNALPAGVYEEQALRQVRQRRYPPRDGGGSYVEVVPFRVGADELSPESPED